MQLGSHPSALPRYAIFYAVPCVFESYTDLEVGRSDNAKSSKVTRAAVKRLSLSSDNSVQACACLELEWMDHHDVKGCDGMKLVVRVTTNEGSQSVSCRYGVLRTL